MCEFSLEHVRNRPAVEGDALVIFQHASQSSFVDPSTASAQDPLAVCLRPGTRLEFEGRIDAMDVYAPDRRIVSSDTEGLGRAVRFDYVNLHMKDNFHDALFFPTGEYVLVGELFPRQRATVLEIPVNVVTHREPTEIGDSYRPLSGVVVEL